MKPSARTLGIAVIGVAIAGFLGLMGLGLTNKSPVTSQSGYTRIQKPAPEFSLPLFNGDSFLLSRYHGRPVVINFWASWCPPCREEAVVLERAWRSYRDSGVMFVGVDLQDSRADAKAYLSEFDITYPNGLDTNGRITVDYGVVGLPVTFFINRFGVVERRWVGAIDERRLVAWIDEMLVGASPPVPSETEATRGPLRLDPGVSPPGAG